MTGSILIYGANGYTGELIARELVALGMAPILSGRNAGAVERLAQELGLTARPAELTDAAAMEAALAGVDVLLNAAGPFAQTWQDATRACLRNHVHYLDITGEPDVLAGCADLDGAARDAGITVMPGVGFDVVPTDCVAALLAARLPDADRLTLAFGGMNQASRGTARTVMSHIDKPVFARLGGKITALPNGQTTTVNFGNGPVTVHATTWGDIVTAWHTTGIPTIKVYIEASPQLRRLLEMGPWPRRFLASTAGRWLTSLQLRLMPPGPDAKARKTWRARVYGRVENTDGQSAELRIETPEGYHLTALTAARIAIAVGNGAVEPGFHTPASAMGGEFILGIDGVVQKE